MTPPNRLPLPPGTPGPLDVDNPGRALQAPASDMRAEFELLSRRVRRDPEAERAFIESKIEMIRKDPNLSQAEKDRAIDMLRCPP